MLASAAHILEACRLDPEGRVTWLDHGKRRRRQRQAGRALSSASIPPRGGICLYHSLSLWSSLTADLDASRNGLGEPGRLMAPGFGKSSASARQ